jgi:hypothetical protein
MKRTFTHPWAIVRRSALNCAADTDEANVRLALGDRSLSRQAPVDERSSSTHTHTLTCGRTFAQHWAIVRPRVTSSHVTYLGHGPHTPSFSHQLPTPHEPIFHAVHPPRLSTHHQITTNHHQALPNHHPWHPPAPIPPSPAATFLFLAPFFIFPSFHYFLSQPSLPHFHSPFF